MANADGYHHYDVNLTALEAKTAIHRGHNLEKILINYPRRAVDMAKPVPAGVPSKYENSGTLSLPPVTSGDIWVNDKRKYVEVLEDKEVIWIEV